MVRQMAELLEKTNSSYFNVFKEMFRDVVAGKRAECADIVAIYICSSVLASSPVWYHKK